MRRLELLASFVPRLGADTASFGAWQSSVGGGTPQDPATLPWFELSELGHEFVQATYEAGWILKDFDWATWAHGPEGQKLANDRTALSKADEDQLAMLLTALIRQDRFVEGALGAAFDSGLLLAIAERARALLNEKR